MNTVRLIVAGLLAILLACLTAAASADTLTVIKFGSGSGTVISNVGAIDCGATCSDTYASSTSITLTAAPAPGSQFTGWLGPCTGAGVCQFSINGPTTVSATFSSAAIAVPPLDIDGNGAYDVLTDGLLIVRHLFGLTGSSLISGAVGSGASRGTAAQIGDYLDDIKPLLDIDGNGQADALTDGLLVIRYMSGLRGSDLILGAVGTGASRTTAAAIEPALAALLPLPGLPPDPSTVAPPTAPSVATILLDATAFLYSGPTPIQTGVAPGTFDPRRVAVLRGKVHARGGAALSGATISILGHAEFGQTLSRADGAFDLVVNGGGALTVDFQKTGFLPVQRQLSVPWQDYTAVPDIVMIPLDSAVTSIAMSSATMQVARGNPATDSNGTRRGTLLVPSGTTANLVMPGGSLQPISALSVRVTEYTIGADGPQAMPAALPATSGYTYAIELSADEAIAAGAKSVSFSSPLAYYVENFLGFPVGGPVPVGFYDRDQAAWVASGNGRVIQIVSIAGGLATVDTVGAGSLPPLVLDDAERAQLATLYQPGQTLWRASIPHFTPTDLNWSYGPPFPQPPGPAPGPPPGPDPNRPDGDGGPDDQECPQSGGSAIACHRQVLGETLPITGTGHALHYTSDRVPGWSAAATLEIPISGPTLSSPPPKRIDLFIGIAGRTFQHSFAPAPNLTYTFTWDGLDVYGRTVVGSQTARVLVANVYDAVYRKQRDDVNAFGLPGDAIGIASPSRAEFTIATQWHAELTRHGAPISDLAGWSLGVHHLFDPNGGTLYLGNGDRVNGRSPVISTAAGSGLACGSASGCGDGGPATAALLTQPHGVAVGPRGDVYFADGPRVRWIDLNGVIHAFAGTGFACNSPSAQCGDGGPATAAKLYLPYGVAAAADGSVYIADIGTATIRRVTPNGTITTVAGMQDVYCSYGQVCGDGGAATAAQFAEPRDVAVGPAGEFYVADTTLHRIRRVGPDGVITTIAGGGQPFCSPGDPCGDGGPATAAFVTPQALLVAPDGSVYFSDQFTNRVRRVAPDGTLYNVAGNGIACTPSGLEPACGEDGPATAASLGQPLGIALAPDGTLYIADVPRIRVWRVGPDGFIHTAAGTGAACETSSSPCGDGGPARSAQFRTVYGVAVVPDGSLYISNLESRIRLVGSAFPRLAQSAILLPSPDGSEAYVFDTTGRHQRTADALTGVTRYQFAYDASGRLASVTDGDGNATTIARDGAGNPTAIISPYGQHTNLSVDANGYLAAVSDPAGQSVGLVARADGLLSTLTDPRGTLHSFTWDDVGRLIRDEDSGGHVITLQRTDSPTGHSVAVTADGQATTYMLERLASGAQHLVTTFADGTSTELLANTDGSIQETYADGTQVVSAFAPDPRWNMQAPLLASRTLTTPGGVSHVSTRSRTLTLASPTDPLSLMTLNESLTVDGHTTTTSYNATTGTLTFLTPAGRSGTVMFDALGHVVGAQMNGLEPLAFSYASHGRLTAVTESTGGTTRTTTLAYGATNPLAAYLAQVTDPLGRSTTFAYDAAGRATQETLPGGRIASFGYDTGGNVTSLTPPGSASHQFAYTIDGQLASYTPPVIAGGGGATQYGYDAVGRLVHVTQPDTRTIDVTYDAAGRPSGLVYSGGTIGASYDTAGNLKTIVAPGGEQIDYAFDGLLTVGETWSGPVTGSVSRTFDNGLRTATRSVNGTAIALSYDADSLLTAAGDLMLTRDPGLGRITATTLGTITDQWSYTTFGGLAHYTASAGGTAIYDVQYARDALGRITTKTETIGGSTDAYDFAYDDAGRLAQVKKNASTIATYTYDTNGNRLTANAVAASYDGQDRLVALGATAYAFTPNGELGSRTTGGQATSYTYDTLGNLLSVQLPGGPLVDYVIDGMGHRVGKKINGAMVQGFLYDERARIVAELDASNTLVSRFVYASRPNVPDYMLRNGIEYRIVSDDLGSVRFVVKSADGTIAQRLDYDAFGNVIADTAPGFQPFGFAGGLYDRDTKLVRFGARHYDAETGRWTTRDPILFAGGDTNLYVYAANDPVNRRDTMGLQDSPGNGGVCIGPPPDLNQRLKDPIFLDPKPLPPKPPLCPTCATPAEQSIAEQAKQSKEERQKNNPTPSGGGGGPNCIGPFCFSGGPNIPSLNALREDVRKWFNSFDIKVEAPIFPDGTLPSTPKDPGGPDPNGPNPKPQGPQCKPALDAPDPLGCEN